jgi:hypothetical protein
MALCTWVPITAGARHDRGTGMRFLPMLAAAGLVAALVRAAVAGPANEPPSCAAVTFRPAPTGSVDGEHDAGLYKSHFGRIEVKAVMKDGVPQSFFVEVNGQRPAAIPGKLPPSVGACAKAKRLGAVGEPEKTCFGDRLAVLIENTDTGRYVLLYAHRGSEWRFCSAGTS